MWIKLLFVFLLTSSLFADTISLHYETPVVSAVRDSLRSSIITSYYQHSLLSTLDLNTGVKLGTYPTFSPDSLRYKVELSYHPFYWITPSVRLTHETLLTTTATVNHALYWVTLSPLPFETVQFFVSAGWYQRLTLLTKATILPSFRGSYSEHDFAFELGFKFKLTEKLRSYLKASTFEELEVYNLSNPFAEVGGSFKTGFKDWEIFSYARYQVLLGFGRLDTFSMALGARTTL